MKALLFAVLFLGVAVPASQSAVSEQDVVAPVVSHGVDVAYMRYYGIDASYMRYY